MSMPVRRRRLVLDACLGTALALGACTKAKEPVVAPDGAEGSPPAAAAVELAPVEHPSQMLPRDTSVLLVGSSVTRAAEVLERDRLVEAFGPQYTSLRSVITGTVGHDLLDPAQWREVGLDPDGPVALAVSDLVTGRMVLFATVADRAKVVELVRRVAGKAEVELVEKPYGSASVLRAKGEGGGAVVLRDRWLALVLDDGRNDVDLAERLVTMDPNVSLAAQVGYRKATGGMRAADLSVFFDVAAMVDHANLEAESHTAAPQSNWAQEELGRAQKEGAPPERLAELEQQAEQQRQWEERWRRQAEGERALAELVVSGVEGVGFSTTVKRSGPVFDGRVVAGPEAFVRRLLDNREGAPALPRSMNGAPMWCGSARVQREAVLELLEAVAAAEGLTFEDFLAEGKAALGLDPKADVQPELAGDLELCVTAEGTLGEGTAEPQEQIGLGAIVQVTDAAKAQYLLAKMATSGSTVGARMRKRGEGYTVGVPKWKTMHLQAVGDRIVVSTDPELGTRLASGDPGSMPSKIRPPGARGAMELSGTAISQAFDFSTGMLWLMVGSTSMAEPMVIAPGMTPEQMEKVPLSGSSKKARKAMEKARAEVDRLEAKRTQAQTQTVLDVTDALGIVVAAGTEDDRGFVLTGGQFLRAPSMGAMVEGLLRGVLGTNRPALDPADQKALDEAWERYAKAQQAFADARMDDAQRFQSKRKR